MGYIIKNLIGLLIGIVLVLAGIFRWYVVLAFLSKHRPVWDWEVVITRVVSIVFGLTSIIFSLRNLIF